jgi:hypothetical protein
MNKSGSQKVGAVTVTMTHAVHTLTGTPDQLRALVKNSKVWDLTPGETVTW